MFWGACHSALAHLILRWLVLCGYCYLSILTTVVRLELLWQDCVLPSRRGPGGAGEAERLSGWGLCIRILPQHPGEVQRCHHMGGTPHSKEVSLGLGMLGTHLLWRCARPRADSQAAASQAVGKKEFSFVDRCPHPRSSPAAHRHLACSQKQQKSCCGFSCLTLNQMLVVQGWWEAGKPEGTVIESKWTVCVHPHIN